MCFFGGGAAPIPPLMPIEAVLGYPSQTTIAIDLPYEADGHQIAELRRWWQGVPESMDGSRMVIRCRGKQVWKSDCYTKGKTR